MDKFPKWAQDRFSGPGPRRVAHCLNLALPLEDPEKLPLMLWDVMAAGPSIHNALRELSFLHFAGFVPSRNGKALMVITEFDGPFEPYVMDFVIVLGDVFDTLLGYVDRDVRGFDLPVRDHPDEFLAFVREWNRVPFFGSGPLQQLFPPDFDYPLFCADPLTTALDVMGPRKTLPPPALDRPAAFVDLADVQGNILRSYAAKAAAHHFFEVIDAKKARAWLSRLPVTPATPWPSSPDGAGVVKPQHPLNVSFTFDGLQALLPQRSASKGLDGFPVAFRQGALARAKRNGDVGASAPEHWLFGRQDDAIHVVLTLSTFDVEQHPLPSASDALVADAQANGLRHVGQHGAAALADDRDYFGYQEGLSEPRISGQCPVRNPRFQPDFQPAASPGEFLLGAGYKDIYGGPSLGKVPEELGTNGTFAAMRLLEMDVDKFEEFLAASSTGANAIAPDVLRARLMGRWANGAPLALHPSHDPAPGGVVNGFDYAPSWERPTTPQDHDGARCPVGAHIRRVNPRSARVAGTPHSRRLIRRGMPSTWQNEEGEQPKGLLGLFIGASLERQFEFIQREWIQGDLGASGIQGTQDPIAGLRDAPTPFRPFADLSSLTLQVPPLTRTRGSLYLFVPGVAALRALGDAAVDRIVAATAPPPASEGLLAPVGKAAKTAAKKLKQQLADPLSKGAK